MSTVTRSLSHAGIYNHPSLVDLSSKATNDGVFVIIVFIKEYII